MANKYQQQRYKSTSGSSLFLSFFVGQLIFSSFTFSWALSRETENSMRDFSKLRLEVKKSNEAVQAPSSSSSPPRPQYYSSPQDNFKSSYEEPSSAASNSDYNEIYGHGLPHPPHLQSHPPPRPLTHPQQPQHLGPPPDAHSHGHGHGHGHPHNYYTTSSSYPHPQDGMGGDDSFKRKGHGDNPEDVVMMPYAPSQEFLTEIEHDSGVLNERGMGGLFDSGDEEQGDEGDDEQQHPSAGGESGDNEDYGYGHEQHGQQPHHGTQHHDGGEGIGSGQHPHHGSPHSNTRYNRYDYSDY